jgi:hypothetical protein
MSQYSSHIVKQLNSHRKYSRLRMPLKRGSFLICVTNVKKVNFPLFLINQALRHEGVWGSGCMDPHFFDLDTSWR